MQQSKFRQKYSQDRSARNTCPPRQTHLCMFLQVFSDVCVVFHKNYERFSNRFISFSDPTGFRANPKMDERHVGFSNTRKSKLVRVHLALYVNGT